LVESAIRKGRVRNRESLDACLQRNSWQTRVEEIVGYVIKATETTRTASDRTEPRAPRVPKEKDSDAEQGMKMGNLTIDRIDFEVDAPNEGAHRTRTFRHLIRHVNSPAGSSAADLGAGPCVFARIASEEGLATTAVDARTDRVPSYEELKPVKFVLSDVREFDLQNFDMVMILGLLYHLEIPDQLNLLARSSGASAVIVDTQVHIPDLVCTPEPERFGNLHVTADGYEGVEFTEAENPMASVGNPRSFWHTEHSLLTLFENTGFREVTVVDPPYQSKHGARRFYLLRPGLPQE
jgi:hypothetical protein